jgi:DNA-binding NtrC family response regulator
MDIPSLVNHFMYKKSREMGFRDVPVLSGDAIGRLLAYGWPGNVRELENAVERELILSRGRPLSFANLICRETGTPSREECGPEGGALTLDAVIAGHIRKVLHSCEGRIEGQGGAAELLAVNPGTLRHRMRKLGIPFGRKAAARRQ